MVDFLSRIDRSVRMSRIRKRDTKPELRVRQLVRALGFRFRLHDQKLPGTPDLVFQRLGKAIEVRGCFWHSHSCRREKPSVATRVDYWRPKLKRNVQRDRQNQRALRALGWTVL